MNLHKQRINLIFLLFLLFNSAKLFSQACNCTIPGTGVITATGSDPNTVNGSQTLVISAGTTYTGRVTLNGGKIINLGTFVPASNSSFTGGGIINNCSVIHFNYSPFIQHFTGPISLTINNCAAGKINVIDNASFYNHGTVNNYGIIEVTNGDFASFHNLTNNNTGYIKTTGTAGTSKFWTEGFLYNYGGIEAFNAGGSELGGTTYNYGVIKSEYGLWNHGITYTECKIIAKNSFSNSTGTINGPTAAGRVGSISVINGSSTNQGGNFTNPGENIDFCDNNTAGGGFDVTYGGNMFGNITYCSRTGNGCTNIPPFIVTITAPSVNICGGKCVTLTATVSGGTSPYTYLWSDGLGTSSTANACPTTTTTYIVSVTDNNGLTANATITINATPVLIADAGPDRSVCTGVPINIGGVNTASGGTPAFTYLWSPNTGLSSTTVANPTVNPASLTLNTPRTYNVTVTDSKGCTATDQAVVTLNNNCCDGTGVTAGPDQQICKWGTAQLNAKGGIVEIPGTTYLWESTPPPGALSSTSISNPTASPLVTTNYKVTINRPGCSTPFTDFVQVEVLDKAILTAGPDQTICVGQSVMLSATVIPGATYEWTTVDGLTLPNIANPTVSPAVTTTYKLTVTGDNVCLLQNTDEVTVTVLNGPLVITSGDVVSCDNNPVQISAAAVGAVSFSWSPATNLTPNATVANPFANPASTTTYEVTVTDASGCTSKEKVTVNKGDPSKVGVNSDQLSCSSSKVTLTAYGGISYKWAPPISCSNCDIITVSPSITTTYQVAITTPNSCVYTKEVTVVVGNSLTVTAGPETTACKGTKVQLTASGGKTYSWQPEGGLSCHDCKDPIAEVSETTTYTVTAVDGTCSGEATVKISINPQADAAIIYTKSNCTANFTATPNGLTTYYWDFGDGTTHTGQTISHNYPKSGLYRVCLKVTGSCGTFTTCKFIKITNCNNACCE